jgi:DNA primase
MLIPHHKIEEVLARADILAIVGRSVQLKKSGRSYKGNCPFHNEKSPSFYVTPERHMWKCFGCGAGGDAIAFLMRQSRKGFVDAVRDLAREVSVDLGGAEDPRAVERAQVKAANELAQQHFVANLADPVKGAIGRKYLADRQVSEEAVVKFGLGYAVAAWNDLGERIVREGALEPALKAGLVAPRPKTAGHYDLFRGRLMIPIRSPEGRTIAFGGRLLEGDQGPKYLNSRESALYIKGEVLFGLDQAREAIRRSGVAILVEGYFDVIGLHQVGVQNVVALSSTTLTEKQLDLLARHGAKELLLLLDGDVAGVKAVERLAGPILAHSVSARVAVLPEGQDPDDFANTHGPSGVADLLKTAVPLTEHLLQKALPQGASAPWEQKITALKALKPVLESMPASLERRLFVSRLATYLGVPELDVERSVGKGAGVQPVQAQVKAVVPTAKVAPPPEVHVGPAEELLCALLLADGTLFLAPGAEAIEEIRHLGVRALLEEGQQGEDLTEVFASMEPSLSKRIQRKRGEILARWPSEPNRREAVAHAAAQVRLLRVEERLVELKKEFARAAEAGLDSEEAITLGEERTRLVELRNRLTAQPDELGLDQPSPLAR